MIEGLQRVGHKATLVAQYKAGKTTFVTNVAKALVDGEPFAGKFETFLPEGNVVCFDYELQPRDSLDNFRRVGVRNTHRILVEHLRGDHLNLANDYVANHVVEYLKKHDAAYLILDTFGRAMRGFGEENSNDDVRAFFMQMDRILREAGLLGCLIPVHTGRSAEAGAQSRARGASVLDDDPDVRWVLHRNGDQRSLSAEGRAGISVEKTPLAFDPETRRLSVSARRTLIPESLREKILAYVEASPGCSLRSIKGGVSGRDTAIADNVRVLLEERRLQLRGGPGRSHRHYATADEPDAHRGREAPSKEGPRASGGASSRKDDSGVGRGDE